MLNWIERLPWWLLIAGSFTLGLAPFVPLPHLFEKLQMLTDGTLSRPIDIFDLVMHGTFPVFALLKLGLALSRRSA
jgi:hypothetical protein